jgi:hypothetical protein
MRARRLHLIASAIFVLAFAAPAFGKPHRSLRTARERATLVMLDDITREQARQREKIALLQADSERRDRNDRIMLMGAIAIAGVVVLYARKKKSNQPNQTLRR